MPASTVLFSVGAGDALREVAVRARKGASPGVVWLPGFMANSRGRKATALETWAETHGRACVLFDYSGRGESGGSFRDGTISRWLEECLAVFEAHCDGPQILVGSSMGGWLALLMARELIRRPAPLAGMVLLAPAVDLTEELLWKRLPEEIRRDIHLKGAWEGSSPSSDHRYIITRNLIEDGRRHLLLGGPIETACPVRILQGLEDADVPWQGTVGLAGQIAHDDVVLSLIKDADHRLQRPQDIERLISAVGEF
jgi:pimeloyl-ACP methyl ester carboxylesterase